MVYMQLIGRPTKYTDELVEVIFFKITTNTISIKKLCKQHPELPSHDTINRWRHSSKHFSDQYRLAKQIQFELLTEQILNILDDVTYYTDSLGNKRIDLVSIKLKVIKVNHIKWLASKLYSK